MKAIIRTIAPVVMMAATAALGPLAAQSTSEDLRVTVGKSVVIDYPTDIGRISTSNPDVVDAVAVSTREVLLHAKSHGTSTIVIWAKTGQRTFYNATVEHNLEPIRKIIHETFPDENIQIVSARDSVTLNGKVTSQAVADRTAVLAASLAKTVVNNLVINPREVEKQVVLRVKFAQLDRSASTQFGVNLMSTGALNTPGAISTGQFGPPKVTDVRGTIPGGLQGTTSQFTLSDALNIFAFRPDLNLASTIKALQSRGVLQIMAEPNLVTTNGREASFLVGGEFPVPILQGGSAGAVTVQFKEFGIRLTFNPQLTPNKTMKLYVRPEVSSIDIANSVTFNGFRIPALATRRMETNIELGPGQSFVIGGLIDDRAEQAFTRIPGLADIPILGALFKSKSTTKSKTELIVLVTPEIVDPLNPGDPKPMPVMPVEFLGPAVPPAPHSAIPPARTPGKKTNARNHRSGTAQSPEMAAGKGSSEIPAVVTAESVRPIMAATTSADSSSSGPPAPVAAPAKTEAAAAEPSPAGGGQGEKTGGQLEKN
ncbi:MAG: pilus assembly protein N-terminal domain-containing protein [Bryobacteraceae bacterium]